MPKITIFTPTYNREQKLKICFKSLVNQTNQDFIWLIIDDGSNDNTKELINDFKKRANFEIQYNYQENGGKHRAHNNAIKRCKTDYFLILDSDDFLSSNAIEKIYEKIKKIDNMDNISGIIGNKYHPNKKVIGTKMPNIKYVTGNELYQKMKFTGDTLRIYKTSILKKFPFPEINNEKFIYENVVFDQIDKKYKMLAIKECLYYVEYQPDGYTSKSKELKNNNPIGYALSLKSAAEYAISKQKKLNWTILYIIWCKNKKIDNSFKNFNNKILYIAVYPIAIIFNLIKFPSFFFEIIDHKRSDLI